MCSPQEPGHHCRALGRRRWLTHFAAATVLLQLLSPPAQAWTPERPILLVTGFAPGGATDVAARLIQDRMASALGPGTRFVIEGRPGASGAIATEWLKGRPADGYTIMLQEFGAGMVTPLATAGGARYDPIADFTHLGLISFAQNVLIANLDFAPRNVPTDAFLARLRTAPPESLAYASSGYGGGNHFRGELLARALGTRFVHVPYRSGGLMVTSVLNGETPFGFASGASAVPLVQDGRLRALGVSGPRRFPVLPDVPTMSELGVPGLELMGYYALVGPAGMPQPVAQALNDALNAALRDPGVRERLLVAGHIPADGPNGLEDVRAYMDLQLIETRAMVTLTGIQLQP